MKKIITMMLVALMTLTACLGLTACKEDKVVDVQTKTITVGYTLYEPMNYKNDEDVLVGFDTELALLVFNALGYKVRFKVISWGQKYTELSSGNIQCIWNGFTANATEEDYDNAKRSDLVDFSLYYMQNAQCIIRKADTAPISSWEDFEGKSVAYEAGSAADSLFSSSFKGNANTKPKTSQMDAINEVNSGTSQYAIVDILLAQSICGEGNYNALTINEGLDLGVEYYAVGFEKGSDLTAKVNVILSAYYEIGLLQELAVKYGLENSLTLGVLPE